MLDIIHICVVYVTTLKEFCSLHLALGFTSSMFVKVIECGFHWSHRIDYNVFVHSQYSTCPSLYSNPPKCPELKSKCLTHVLIFTFVKHSLFLFWSSPQWQFYSVYIFTYSCCFDHKKLLQHHDDAGKCNEKEI